MQESVLEVGALHQDMVRKLEDALEGARRDALIQDLAGIFRRFGLRTIGLPVALDGEGIFFQLDVELVLLTGQKEFGRARPGFNVMSLVAEIKAVMPGGLKLTDDGNIEITGRDDPSVRIEVVFPNGIRVLVPGRDQATLSAVLAALADSSRETGSC